jgi:hypothetical protein
MRAAVARAIAHASVRPCQPVMAFVQPLLTMRVCVWPAVCSRTDLETVTGAAWNVLRVKVAAADVGQDDVERSLSTARSRMEVSFFHATASVYATKEV